MPGETMLGSRFRFSVYLCYSVLGCEPGGNQTVCDGLDCEGVDPR